MIDALFVGIRWFTTRAYRVSERLFYVVFPIIYLSLLMGFAFFRCPWETIAVTGRWPGFFKAAWRERDGWR